MRAASVFFPTLVFEYTFDGLSKQNAPRPVRDDNDDDDAGGDDDDDGYRSGSRALSDRRI
jgi:hypothetical protein